MRILTALLVLIQFTAFAQVRKARALGAVVSDTTMLSRLTLAIPQAGAAVALPNSVRMDGECPPVISQCNIGSCVSYATAYALCGILAKRKFGAGSTENCLFSPLYMHYFIKVCSNDCEKCGASLVGAANFLTKTGVPSYLSWRPDSCSLNSCNSVPTPVPTSFYKLSSFKPLILPGVQYTANYKKNTIKYYLSQHFPVPIAMDLDSSFEDGTAFNNRDDTWSKFQGESIGGHAMLIVGYDNSRKAFLLMNSWGTDDWNLARSPGDDIRPGFCWISYEIIENYCYEAFVANESSPYSISIRKFYSSNKIVKDSTETQKSKNLNQLSRKVATKEAIQDGVPFFVTNRFNEYGNVRLIPVNINKTQGEATIAIYNVAGRTPSLNSIFHIKLKETVKFEADNQRFEFTAEYIKPWRRYLGVFPGEKALFYTLKIL